MFKTINLRKFIISIGITIGVGLLAGLLTRGQMEMFAQMNQPPLSPPGWVFGVVWSILYVLMGLALYIVWNGEKDSKGAITLYAIQLIINFIWPILFFNYGLYCFSAIWLGLLWIMVFLTTIAFYRQNDVAGKLFLPYLLWCTFALYLNIGVCVLN